MAPAPKTRTATKPATGTSTPPVILLLSSNPSLPIALRAALAGKENLRLITLRDGPALKKFAAQDKAPALALWDARTFPAEMLAAPGAPAWKCPLYALGRASSAGKFPLAGHLPLPLPVSSLRALLSKAAAEKKPKTTRLPGKIQLDMRARCLIGPQGARVVLTEKEAALLAALHQARGATVSAQTLLRQIWKHQSKLQTHTLPTHMHRLRGKLKDFPALAAAVRTRPGGYALREKP